MAFAHLHVHTEYSLLDGSNKIKEYVARVKELGMNSAAITDHGVMYGVIDFYRAARENGIKPIIGCEIYVANEDGEKLWKALWQEGSKEGLKNIGLGARDTLRLEMGFCLYGNDIDDTTSPIEAGLNWLTKFVDGKEFIDRKLMEEQKAGGLTRKLVGFKMIDRGIPRHGYQIASPEGDIIGQVTSGTMSPCLKQGIGMGYVKKEFAKVGTQIAIVIREKLMKAEVVKLPFIQQK